MGRTPRNRTPVHLTPRIEDGKPTLAHLYTPEPEYFEHGVQLVLPFLNSEDPKYWMEIN